MPDAISAETREADARRCESLARWDNPQPPITPAESTAFFNRLAELSRRAAKFEVLAELLSGAWFYGPEEIQCDHFGTKFFFKQTSAFKPGCLDGVPDDLLVQEVPW